jgi:hypothetical protein
MVIWDENKVRLLSEIREIGLETPTIAYIVTKTAPKSIGAIGGNAGDGDWLRARHILLQDESYIEEIVGELRRAIAHVEAGTYRRGDVFGELQVTDPRVLPDLSVPSERRFVEFLPVYSLSNAAGYFGSGRAVELEGWIQVNGRVEADMFVALASGKAMEPRIREGELLVFRRSGARVEDRIVLAQWEGPDDPETGSTYSVRRYSRSGNLEDGLRVELKSDNPEFAPIVLKPRFEDDVQVVAEFVQVLR